MKHRIFKFRVWDSAEKKYRYDLSIDWNKYTNENFGIDAGEGHYPVSDGYIIQQFTGLKDTTGEEIYEGDIVTYVEGVELGDKTKEVAVVIYDESFACFGYSDSPEKDCKNYPWEGVVSKPSVIGNVFEDPELLKPV